ncbi:hypothetical protein ABT117_38590 [Streptomyces sp. NPDC002262]|uniref:hypothetical protein n=1 Tax=Streptomyces sp. NPDC002262 TaxID=3154414 RepID=UPI00332A5859
MPATRRKYAAAAASLGAAALILSAANPAAAWSRFYSQSYGPCSGAAGNAYRTQLKTNVLEPTGLGSATTGYMTMNVEWCSDGTKFTKYPYIYSSQAAVTQGGGLTNLQRETYQKSQGKPASATGAAQVVTEAKWDRPGTATVDASALGLVGGAVTIDPARFISRMTLTIYPSDRGAQYGNTVDCTGYTDLTGSYECDLNG